VVDDQRTDDRDTLMINQHTDDRISNDRDTLLINTLMIAARITNKLMTAPLMTATHEWPQY
jgi:hypothetical protein